MTSKMSKKLGLFVHENSKKIVPAFTFCGKVCFLYELVFWTFIKVFQNGEIMSRKFIISIFRVLFKAQLKKTFQFSSEISSIDQKPSF